MKTVNLYNRRFMGIVLDSERTPFQSLKRIDDLIFDSLLVDAIDEQVTIYFDQGLMKIGREVIGFDGAFKALTDISVEDFSPVVATREEFSQIDFQEIIKKISQLKRGRAVIDVSGRVILDLF